MYKNQLQELAQRSCFNLPSYTCIREGPDHAPRFKAAVNFNGETFESPSFCTTLRQAEHSAAEVALNALSTRGPSHSLAARILVSCVCVCTRVRACDFLLDARVPPESLLILVDAHFV
ncbi:Double-stranded RNA-binding protein 2 [Sarracenia purpurea var. burkii]